MKGNASSTAALLAALAAGALLAPGCGGKAQQASKPGAPAIASARIVPDQPFAGATLSINVTMADTLHSMLSYTSEWYVDGKLAATVDGTEFDSRGLAPGAVVTAKVKASDSTGTSDQAATPPVTLVENLSGIDSVQLAPMPVPSNCASLTAKAFVHPGASPNLKTSYRWIVAGKEQTETGPTLGVSGLKAGDRITVEATAAIGGKQGNPFRVTATVANGAPVVNSITPVSQDAVAYKYQISASDPENDPISFQMVSGPAGVTVDNAGLVTVPVALGGQTIRIKVSDNTGNWTEANLETAK
ncbi:MAG TPA: hypothetical protein VMF29_02265 [Candidatus Edwardsbacteria bacterium]|nr:hypothetical protein [Candidatus Edwardsbacteria bacterium]